MPLRDVVKRFGRSVAKARRGRSTPEMVRRRHIAERLDTLTTLGEVFQSSGWGDDLTTIKGIGDATAEAFRRHGVNSFDDLATVSPETVEAVDAEVRGVKGKIGPWREAAADARRATHPDADLYHRVVKGSAGRSFETSGERRGIVRTIGNFGGTARPVDVDVLDAPDGHADSRRLQQALLDLPSVGGVARIPVVSPEDVREARFIAAAVRGGVPLDDDLAERMNELSARTGYDFTHSVADDEASEVTSGDEEEDRIRLAPPAYDDAPGGGRFVHDEDSSAASSYDDAPGGGQRYQDLPVRPGYQELRKANAYQNPEPRPRYDHIYVTPRHEPQAAAHPAERPTAAATYDELSSLDPRSPEYDELSSLLPDAERSRAAPAATGTRVQGGSHYQPADPVRPRAAGNSVDREPPTVEGPPGSGEGGPEGEAEAEETEEEGER